MKHIIRFDKLFEYSLTHNYNMHSYVHQQVAWHPTPKVAGGAAFDERLRTPIVPVKPLQRGMWPAFAVVQLKCWAPPKRVTTEDGQRLHMIPHHLRRLSPPHKPILTRHWGMLPYLKYPSAPSRERWASGVGKLLKAKSWDDAQEEAEVEEEEEEEEGEEEEEEED